MRVARTAAGMGVDVATIEKAIPGLDLSGTSLADIPSRIANAVAAVEAKAHDQGAGSNVGKDIDQARASARAKLDDMDTSGALAVWDDLLNKDVDALNSLTRRRVAMLHEKAAIHRLRFEHFQALAVLGEVVRLDPENVDALIESGEIERNIGTLAKALPQFEAALSVAKRNGNNWGTALSLERIGDVLRAQGDLGGALKHYGEGLEISRGLYVQDKSHAERARDVSVSVNKIGDVLRAQGDLGGALKHYGEGLEISRGLYVQDKSHAERARDVSLSLQRIGLIAEQQERLVDACAAYREGRVIISELQARSPDIAVLHDDLAFFDQGLKNAECG